MTWAIRWQFPSAAPKWQPSGKVTGSKEALRGRSRACGAPGAITCAAPRPRGRRTLRGLRLLAIGSSSSLIERVASCSTSHRLDASTKLCVSEIVSAPGGPTLRTACAQRLGLKHTSPAFWRRRGHPEGTQRVLRGSSEGAQKELWELVRYSRGAAHLEAMVEPRTPHVRVLLVQILREEVRERRAVAVVAVVAAAAAGHAAREEGVVVAVRAHPLLAPSRHPQPRRREVLPRAGRSGEIMARVRALAVKREGRARVRALAALRSRRASWSPCRSCRCRATACRRLSCRAPDERWGTDVRRECSVAIPAQRQSSGNRVTRCKLSGHRVALEWHLTHEGARSKSDGTTKSFWSAALPPRT